MGVQVYKCMGVHSYWCTEIMGVQRCTTEQVYKCLGVQMYRCTRVYECTGV